MSVETPKAHRYLIFGPPHSFSENNFFYSKTSLKILLSMPLPSKDA